MNLLITSGQYVISELSSEFGRIPPCFLPVQNNPLIYQQIKENEGKYERIILTVPIDYEVDKHDIRCLERQGVEIFKTSIKLSLGAAIHSVLNAHPALLEERIDILYGDTLIFRPPHDNSDWIAVGPTSEYYGWHYTEQSKGSSSPVWEGMFSFSSAAALHSQLTQTDDFIAATQSYSNSYNKLTNFYTEEWLDFGHVHTFYTSRQTITTQRHFNEIEVNNGILRKSSENLLKMKGESHWFESVPRDIKVYTPNYLGRSPDKRGYDLEYLPLPTLSEIYTFGRLPHKSWSKIIDSCDRFLSTCASTRHNDSKYQEEAVGLYKKKTWDRLKDFSQQQGIDLDQPWILNGNPLPSLGVMASQAIDSTLEGAPYISVTHGDFCFSNILYDFRLSRIKVIDPRGLDSNSNPTILGDLRYDIAKLAHSVVGLYDFIIAGKFELNIKDSQVSFYIYADHTSAVVESFNKHLFAGRTLEEWKIAPIMVLLFLSMLPLHADNPTRQMGLMANAMRLYQDWRKA